MWNSWQLQKIFCFQFFISKSQFRIHEVLVFECRNMHKYDTSVRKKRRVARFIASWELYKNERIRTRVGESGPQTDWEIHYARTLCCEAELLAFNSNQTHRESSGGQQERKSKKWGSKKKGERVERSEQRKRARKRVFLAVAPYLARSRREDVLHEGAISFPRSLILDRPSCAIVNIFSMYFDLNCPRKKMLFQSESQDHVTGKYIFV